MTEWTDVVRLKNILNSEPSACEPNTHLAQTWNQAHAIPGAILIPGYEIYEELGRGGMGVVYKAKQLRLNRIVALKVIIGGSFAGPVEKARFQMEGEAVARLQHGNIVQVYDIGQHAGIEYIAFEFVDGPTLRRWQNGQPMNPRLSAQIAAAVARAVQHAHDQGIVHRDLKPANILLNGVPVRAAFSGNGSKTDLDMTASEHIPKVTDFGLAKSLEGGKDLTQTGVACGTPNYMSPEQVQGGPNSARPTVDVWGIGTILFELLTGRPPFMSWDAATIMQDILLTDAPCVKKLRPEIPRDLAILVAKCLERDPSRRYLSPGAVAEDLERFLAGKPILARAIGRMEQVRRWVIRNPLATTMGVVLAVGLAIVSSFAIALDQLAERERAATARERLALQEEAKQRLEAEEAKRNAEKARDEVKSAFNRVDAALKQVEEERDRAEKNLSMARAAVDHLLTTLSAHSESENPSLIPVFQDLLRVFEPFVTQMLDQKSGDRDLRFDQAVIARNRALMEATSGHRAAARENLDLASSRFRDLLKDYPDDHDCRLQFGYTLSCLASWSIENKFPDAEKLLQSALVYLEEYRREFPSEVLAINAIIRVHLAMTMLPGEKYNDEHNRAVLDIVDEFAARGPLSSHLQMMRAHALNNIASTLTNCGKTDEAEFYWLKVLALREEMNRKASQDKICRYELAKCLTNYANQLTKTNRPQNAFKMRERAAGLFDTLNDDARFRATYIPLMVDSDYVLAGFYDKQNSTEKAIARLSNALELNAILLKRDYTPASVKELNADLLTRRAELTQKLARHDQAARDYRAAMEFTTKPPQREYCSARLVQALALSGDLPAAVDLANTLNVAAFSHPYPCLELARSWLLIAKLPNGELGNPVASVRDEITRKALENARQAVLAAKDKGLFQNPNEVRIFHSQKDFELVWDLIPRLTK